MAVDEVTMVLVGDGCSNTMQRSLIAELSNMYPFFSVQRSKTKSYLILVSFKTKKNKTKSQIVELGTSVCWTSCNTAVIAKVKR